jgi:hypothetical protein
MLRAVAQFGAVSIGGFLRRGRDRISRRVTPLSALTGLCGSNSASFSRWQCENRLGGLPGGRVVAARWELGGTVL